MCKAHILFGEKKILVIITDSHTDTQLAQFDAAASVMLMKKKNKSI